MSPNSLLRTALAVLNASAAGAPIDPEDLLKLRHAAGPESAAWAADILAQHIFSVEARRMRRGQPVAAQK